MRYEASVVTAAAPRVVWNVLVDIDWWPSWTRSVVMAHRLDGGELRVGSRARLRQPRLRPSTWTVTELEHRVGFTWESRTLGLRTIARHQLLPASHGGTRIVLGIEQSGWTVGLADRVLGDRVRSYVKAEAEGLKAASERVAPD